jgi:hypothetical protein
MDPVCLGDVFKTDDGFERFSGLRASSDRIADLDDWGLATTGRVLSHSPIEPFVTA